MSTYAMSDIHGCYDEYLKMLEKINFSDEDTMIIAGDYIDRGSQSYEMMEYVTRAPNNVVLLKGNHDVEFAYYVDLMERMKGLLLDETDDSSLEDTYMLYRMAIQSGVGRFDHYETIEGLIKERGVTLAKMKEWSQAIENLEYVYKTTVNEKQFIVVHAGYIEKNLSERHLTVEHFYLYARDEAYTEGGKRGCTIIAGHTPTISSRHMPYTDGTIFKYYNEDLDCTYYDIDCGAVFKKLRNHGNMACLRLDDEQAVYL